jgi:P pilus assembly chaperone PapD
MRRKNDKLNISSHIKVSGRSWWIAPLLCLLFSVVPVRAAFTVDPSVVTFLADKGEKTAFIELVHSGGDPAAVQLSIFERLLDLDGELVKERLPVSTDFLVHPRQVILYPGERATVQVQYKGKGRITTDRAYILYAQEVPISVAKDEDGVNLSIKMVMNYYTVVALETGKPGKLAFVSSKVLGGGRVEVLAENRGAGRVKMESLKLMVGGKLIKDFTGASNSIMPGQRRRFTFEWPKAVTEREIKFSY